MSMDDILTVSDLTLSYGKYPAVTGASFSVRSGDAVAIIGPNGSGKSTLVRAIVGLHAPSAGTISWHTTDGRAANIGYLPQNTLSADILFPASVREIITTGLYVRTRGTRASSSLRTRVDAIMARLGIAELAERQIGKLSGGQRQRVLLARALVSSPDILVLDELTSALDPGFRDEFYAIIGGLNKTDGITFILVSHDIGSVAKHTNTMIYLDRRIVFHGSYSDFCSSSDMTSYFGSMTQHQMCGRHTHDNNA